MKDPKDLPPEFKDLRRRAEKEIKADAIAPEAMSPAECARLIHELRVQQTELEMQNEELRQAQAQLADPGTNMPTSMTLHRWAISPWMSGAGSWRPT